MKRSIIFLIIAMMLVVAIAAVASGCKQAEQAGESSSTSVTEAAGENGAVDESSTTETEAEENEEDEGSVGESAEERSSTTEESSPERSVVAEPSITVISPAPGSSVTGSKVKVTVEVAGFNLVDKLGKPAVKGEGHIHYTLDDMAPVPSFMPTIELEVAPGQHVLTVALHNNDHTPLSPAVEATTKFTSK